LSSSDSSSSVSLASFSRRFARVEAEERDGAGPAAELRHHRRLGVGVASARPQWREGAVASSIWSIPWQPGLSFSLNGELAPEAAVDHLRTVRSSAPSPCSLQIKVEPRRLHRIRAVVVWAAADARGTSQPNAASAKAVGDEEVEAMEPCVADRAVNEPSSSEPGAASSSLIETRAELVPRLRSMRLCEPVYKIKLGSTQVGSLGLV
jgi:hypothetical protein